MSFDPLSLISSVPSIMSLFGGGTAAPYRKEQEQLAARQNQISQALTDNNNPLYQQLYGQYQQQNKNNLAETIAELQRQNRMNTQNGRTPLFNQERGGETVFRNLMQGYQNSGAQADQQTRQGLAQAMGGAGSALGGYNQISPYGIKANSAPLLGYQGIYDILRGNDYGSNGGGNTENITWNAPRRVASPMNGGL